MKGIHSISKGIIANSYVEQDRNNILGNKITIEGTHLNSYVKDNTVVCKSIDIYFDADVAKRINHALENNMISRYRDLVSYIKSFNDSYNIGEFLSKENNTYLIIAPKSFIEGRTLANLSKVYKMIRKYKI